jgi:hypothetical protein
MLPANLNESEFSRYPPQAKALAVAQLPLMRQMPLVFLPSLLREVIEYDYKFPVEREQLDRQFAYLGQLSPPELMKEFGDFSRIRLTTEQSNFDWAGRPFEFTEQLSAYLWQSHQMNAFREAAVAYGSRLQLSRASQALPIRRLGISVIGRGASPDQPALFHKLREHGTHFTNVDPTNGLETLINSVELRSQKYPLPFAHWYVDGGTPVKHSGSLTSISYATLGLARAALLRHIQEQVNRPGMGPEELRDRLSRLSPSDLGLENDSLVSHFAVKVLTEGSGTQIFSTTFAQWTAREALRRAEPLTLLVRFAPRQRQRPMSELLTGDERTPQVDPEGSLVDADMASYYHWINQQRLPGASGGSFLVWFEDQQQALAVGPGLPRRTQSNSPITVSGLLSLVTG